MDSAPGPTDVSAPADAATERVAPLRRWHRPTAVALLLVLGVNACYATRPIEGRPAPETRVVFDLTDQGRLANAALVGQSVDEIEGTLEAVTDSTYTVRITAVQNLRGQIVPWNGERVSLRQDHVTNLRQRHFSRTRTMLVGAAAVATVLGVLLTTKLVGGGSTTDREDPRPGGGDH